MCRNQASFLKKTEEPFFNNWEKTDDNHGTCIYKSQFEAWLQFGKGQVEIERRLNPAHWRPPDDEHLWLGKQSTCPSIADFKWGTACPWLSWGICNSRKPINHCVRFSTSQPCGMLPLHGCKTTRSTVYHEWQASPQGDHMRDLSTQNRLG